MSDMTPETLRELLRYAPETGKLFWRARDSDGFGPAGAGGQDGNCARWNARYAGREAFTAVSTQGYHRGSINNKSYTAHCLIWAMETGAFCASDIDHINGVKTDNRWANLRAATRSQNIQNQALKAANTSGVKGVSWITRAQKWQAAIMVNGKSKFLGYFDDINLAAAAVRIAREEMHGSFCNHGDIA